MKRVRPSHLTEGNTVHYVWSIEEPVAANVSRGIDVVIEISRGVIALGWGIDAAVGSASVLSDAEVEALLGERWLPGIESTENGLRVPVAGTLGALIERHDRFRSRISESGVLTPPPPLTAYATVAYHCATHPPAPGASAFALLNLDTQGFVAFDTARRGLTVAGMLRHTVKLAASQAGWPEQEVGSFVLGHGEPRGSSEHSPVGLRRFAYLPLPSIESRGSGRARVAGPVRRVMLTCFADGCEEKLAWARRALGGMELLDERSGRAVAFLGPAAADDHVVHSYTRPASTWATVTPVVLPGYDDPAHYRRRLKKGVNAEEQKQLLDRLDRRVDGLIRKAIEQAGYAKDLATNAEIEWRQVGFWPGAELAHLYGVPDHLTRFPRLHVRLAWRDPAGHWLEVPGPLCIGSGRFLGLGLFAGHRQEDSGGNLR
jgi:CRISPR-associated protein Csb2